MEQKGTKATHSAPIIPPSYTQGDYFRDTRRHSADAAFKADNFLRLFLSVAKRDHLSVRSWIDVGCGSGDIIQKIADSLKHSRFASVTFKAYDVSPHVLEIEKEGIEYIHGDFRETNDLADLVTLFDVLEHVPDPVGFIRGIAERCGMIGFHIPLDNSLNFAVRNLFRAKLRDPGHLIFMDTVSALNLLAFSGLKVIDYEYTFSFLAPSGRKTLLQKTAFPLRYLLARINPWLLSKTLGGASLVVIAVTPRGLREYYQGPA